MNPTVGRSVHFWMGEPADDKPYAATISGINEDGTVSLACMPRSRNQGVFVMLNVSEALEPTKGSWNWPPITP